MQPPTAHDLACVVHVHSTCSDGTATVPELLAAARDAGAGALLLTDHDTLAGRRWEGIHDGVALVVGVEVTARVGHYLALGLDAPLDHAGLDAPAIAAAVRAGGGVGFAAHPFSAGGHMLAPRLARRIVLPHGWPALDAPGGCDGIELWSVTTDAAEAWRTPAAALRWLRDPVAATASGPPPHHLRAWDALSARRRLPALGGLDGHAPGIRLRGAVRSPLSHARTFGLLQTHLLTERPLSGDLLADRATVVAALRAGAAWLVRPCVAPAAGARLWAELADGAVVPMGEEAALDPAGPASAAGPAVPAAPAPAEPAPRRARAVLRATLPRRARLRILRDGVEIARRDDADTLELPLDHPGAHRVEAWVGEALWLLSNPVHLR